MSFYQQLLAATETQREQFLAIPLLHQGIAGKITREQYIAFLSEAYYHVKHTLPLLMACGARLPERLEWLREAVSHYIEEETGHQEWILNDIRHAGGDAEAVRNGQPSLATELMVSYAWDTVQRRNPVGFFGMVLVLARIFHPLLAFPGGQWMEDVVPRTGRGKAREGLFSRLQAHLSLTPIVCQRAGAALTGGYPGTSRSATVQNRR